MNVVIGALKNSGSSRWSEGRVMNTWCKLMFSTQYESQADQAIEVKFTCGFGSHLKQQTAQTRWIKYIPIKVNIFAWRARQDCLPTRVNLIRRGITIESSLCPVCSVCEEDVCHIFFRCDLAQLVLRRICRWWGLDPHDWSSFQEWQSWILSIQFSSKVKAMLEGVFLNDRVQQGFDRKGFLGLRLSGVETRGPVYDIEKFDGTGDFGLWRIKMRALLIQHGCEAALEVLPADMEAEAKAELNKKAHSAVILCLGNKVLREVTGETTAAGGRTDREGFLQSRGKSRSKSRGGRLKCYICQSEDHLKRNCPKNNRKKSTGYAKKDEQPSSSGSTYDDSEVMMVMSTQAQALLDLIMDSGCSYHMTPRYWQGEVTDREMGPKFCVKQRSRNKKGIIAYNSLDGHAMAGELNASIEEKDSLAQVWHKRLGHISEAGLQVLEKQGLFGKESLEDGNEEDAWEQETKSPPELTDYQIDSFAGSRVEEDTHEPLHTGAVACGNSSRVGKLLMKEENGLSRKNKNRIQGKVVARGFTQRQQSHPSQWIGGLMSTAEQWFQGVAGRQLRIYKSDMHQELGEAQEDTLGMEITMGISIEMPLGGALQAVAEGLSGFVDSDYAKDPDKGRSITGYAFLVQRCVVSWKATLQHVVALSTTEAEYMALTEAVKEAIWLRGLLEELGVELNTVAVNCDNQGAIHLSRNHVFHERTKHINVRYHFIREVLEAKTVEVLKVGTEHNAADALTKVVPGHKLQHCLELLSVVDYIFLPPSPPSSPSMTIDLATVPPPSPPSSPPNSPPYSEIIRSILLIDFLYVNRFPYGVASSKPDCQNEVRSSAFDSYNMSSTEVVTSVRKEDNYKTRSSDSPLHENEPVNKEKFHTMNNESFERGLLDHFSVAETSDEIFGNKIYSTPLDGINFDEDRGIGMHDLNLAFGNHHDLYADLASVNQKKDGVNCSVFPPNIDVQTNLSMVNNSMVKDLKRGRETVSGSFISSSNSHNTQNRALQHNVNNTGYPDRTWEDHR
ncbi:retrovirus-related pol polyprotein from transposon TNT 1-94 [Tanacetum coccineum]|uniref:Retrovirus-related pol polyprotein from transposon TNT 1-94 n=1 Tax=Tanacetum coccineum TaxID=301880 RepID=A0ABQ4ZLN9_9ASTR